MKNMKFRIESPEHSAAIQKELFRLGYKFVTYPHNTFAFLDLPFLFAGNTEDGYPSIRIHRIKKVFKDHSYTETTLEELKLMKP